MTDTDTFTSNLTGGSFRINHELNFDDRCVIYLLTWKQCQKQFTGETMDDLTHRWKHDNSNPGKLDRKEYLMEKHLYRSYSSPVNTELLNSASVTLIDKTDRSDPKKRKTTG